MRDAAGAILPGANMVERQRKRAEERKKREAEKSESSVPAKRPLSPLAKGKDVIIDLDKPPKKKKKVEDVTPVDTEDVTMFFPVESSILNEPEKCLGELKKILLPDDARRIGSLSLKNIEDRGVQSMAQGLQLFLAISEELRLKRSDHRQTLCELEAAKGEIDTLNVVKGEFEAMKAKVYNVEVKNSGLEGKLADVEAELKAARDQIDVLQKKNEDLLEAEEDAEIDIGAQMHYMLMCEYTDHKGEGWKVDQTIVDFETMNPNHPLVLTRQAERSKEPEEAELAKAKDGGEVKEA